MRLIQLSQGFVAKVDDADEQAVLSMGRWQVQKYRTKTRVIYYAKTTALDYTVLLHRFVIQRANGENYFMPATKLVDHKNGDGLDCQRENLRWSNSSINALNSVDLWAHNTSGVKGVSFVKNRNKWAAEITFEGVKYRLGNHDTLEQAAEARKNKEDELWAIYNKYGSTLGTSLSDLNLGNS